MKKKDGNCDDKLKIMNRNREYYVSKKFICSVVPYFEKMFCSDLLESKENKVELDFDEHVFDSILSWIHTELFIMQMDHVIRFFDAADYLMINERLHEPCLSYFHANFTIEYLPTVLSQVTKVSKLIDSGSIENFICRHFLKIANTNVFLDYPVETIEAILKLDLVVDSEYRIFESIMKWINKKADFRKRLLPQLLKCIRWSFMDPKDLLKLKNNELIKSLNNIDSIISSCVKSDINRSKQNFFISIHRIDDSRLRINVFDSELFCLPIGDFTLDDKMSLDFVHGEHISDILFDSGREGIRIDWSKKTFRWLDFKVAGKNYYNQINESIVKFSADLRFHDRYLEDKNTKLPSSISWDEIVFLEANANNNFILIGKTKDEKKWFGLFPVIHESWFNNFKNYGHSFQATVLDDVVYILTKDQEFIQFNYETKCFNKSEPFKDEKLDFNDLILTSQQTGDDKVILVNKTSRKISFFCVNQKKWIEKYRIMNVNTCPESSSVNRLIAFTSTFLSLKNINPLYNQNFS
ncbi:uncharacterized protein LOC107360970 [Tetranychus urticae]|uniref:uncharacterized protein LOC107360970 n=1 Tax=Tetranychus urticae TaxID=32264 RepID=UPI00077BE0EE|nr:uncharacterized protein LOC107360970 [Tetranychus urticae]